MSKMTWQQYDEKYRLASTLNDAANACYVSGSNNPPSFLATYFRKKTSSDVVASVSAQEVLDGAGGHTLLLSLALAGGASVTSAVSHSSTLTPWHPSAARTAVLVANAQDKKPRFGAAAELIKGSISSLLCGTTVTGQEAFDAKLHELDGTANFARLMAHVAACISVSAAKLAAASLRVCLHQHLATAYYPLGEQPNGFFLPTPIFTLFAVEPKGMGRTRVREVVVLPPKGTDISAQVLQKMASLVDHVSAKLEDLPTNTDGSFRYNGFESLAQCVDFTEELMKDAGLVAGKDFCVGLVIDAALCYKPDTQKYSILEGTEYSGAQVAETLAQLTRDKKNLVYLEDTHTDSDTAEMRRLMARVGTAVTLAGNNCYAGNVDAIRRGVKEMLTNSCVLRLNDCGTITDSFKAARAFAEYPGSTLTVCSETVEGSGPFLADYAVAIGARYLRVGGLLREQHAAIATRLLELRAELEASDSLVAAPALPVIATPPAPADVVVEVVAAKGAKKK